MDIYCKNYRKHAESSYPKILVLISNRKPKVKSKCTECLTDRMFFNKVNDMYDLEHLVKRFLFTDIFSKRT